jgi:hypothetical protein
MPPPPRATHSPDDPLRRQIVWDPVLVRTLNDEILSIAGLHAPGDDLYVLCECANGCLERIKISPDCYEAIRAESTRFLVKPGHVDPGVDTVVEETAGYRVVEKSRGSEAAGLRPLASTPPARRAAQ